MSTKAAVIASIVLFMTTIGVGFAILASMSGRRLSERASQLGSGLGLVCALGFSVIWGFWIYQRRAKPTRKRGTKKNRKRRR